jgi:hypothetical protein
MNERRMTLRSFYLSFSLFFFFSFLDVAFWLQNIDHNAIRVLLNGIRETFVIV